MEQGKDLADGDVRSIEIVGILTNRENKKAKPKHKKGKKNKQTNKQIDSRQTKLSYRITELWSSVDTIYIKKLIIAHHSYKFSNINLLQRYHRKEKHIS